MRGLDRRGAYPDPVDRGRAADLVRDHEERVPVRALVLGDEDDALGAEIACGFPVPSVSSPAVT